MEWRARSMRSRPTSRSTSATSVSGSRSRSGFLKEEPAPAARHRQSDRRDRKLGHPREAGGQDQSGRGPGNPQHLLKYQYQPRRRSRGWLSSMVEHRRRLRDDLTTSPSLRGYAREQSRGVLPGRPPAGADRDRPRRGCLAAGVALHPGADPGPGFFARLMAGIAVQKGQTATIAVGDRRDRRDTEPQSLWITNQIGEACHVAGSRRHPGRVLILMAPLGARSAGLVVWWDQGAYARGRRGAREIVAAFEQKTGKQVELTLYSLDQLRTRSWRRSRPAGPPTSRTASG